MNSFSISLLIDKIIEGDTVAFSQFYDIYYPRIYRFSKYMVRSEEICQEVVSDVFVSIWQSRTRLDKIENIESYLFTIARNQSLRYLQKNAKNIVSSVEDLSVSIVSDAQTPEQIQVSEETLKAINKAINELPERCRTIFLMAREENLTYHQIAEILSISEKTVNAQMVTAIKKLSAALGAYSLYIAFIINSLEK